jgi:hypothetical protein
LYRGKIEVSYFFLSLLVDLTNASSLAIYLTAVKRRMAATIGKTAAIEKEDPSGLVKKKYNIHA